MGAHGSCVARDEFKGGLACKINVETVVETVEEVVEEVEEGTLNVPDSVVEFCSRLGEE